MTKLSYFKAVYRRKMIYLIENGSNEGSSEV